MANALSKCLPWVQPLLQVVGLEKEWAEFTGTKYCLATNSGTSALHMAVAAAGIGGYRPLVALFRDTHIVLVTETVTDCRDPKDNKYFELAHEEQASCIITGDKDLLDLHPYRGIAILTSRQFFDAFPCG